MFGASPCPDISPQLHLDNAVHHVCYWSLKSRQVADGGLSESWNWHRVSTLWFGGGVYEWHIEAKTKSTPTHLLRSINAIIIINYAFYTLNRIFTLMSFLGKYVPVDDLCPGTFSCFPLVGSISHKDTIAATTAKFSLSAMIRPLHPDAPPPNGLMVCMSARIAPVSGSVVMNLNGSY